MTEKRKNSYVASNQGCARVGLLVSFLWSSCAGVFLIGLTLFITATQQELTAVGLRTTAVIQDCWLQKGNKGGTSTHFLYQYTVEGQTYYEQYSPLGIDPVCADWQGKTVEIRYHPANPAHSEIITPNVTTPDSAHFFMRIFLIGLGLFALGIGWNYGRQLWRAGG